MKGMAMRNFVLMVFLGLALAGCGDNNTSALTGDPAPEPRATVLFRFVLARAVPAAVTQIEVRGFDINGNLSFEPRTFGKAAEVEVGNIPLQVRTLRVRYFQGSFLVGQGDIEVLLSSNGRHLIDDPDFTDVTVTNLAILPAGPITVNVNGTSQLAVTVTLSTGEQFAVTSDSTFLSSTPAVATVGADTGLVTGVATGPATITATYRGVNTQIVVNVP